MKNLTLLITLFLIAFLTSCEKSKKYNKIDKGDYNILEIEGCQYIEVDQMTGTNIGYYSLTHKGNCKFCIERNSRK